MEKITALLLALLRGRQKILPFNDKRFNTAFSPVVALLQSSILEIVEQIPDKLC